MTNDTSMNKSELITALAKLPDDVIIVAQVCANDGSAWSMEVKVTDVLPHFNWSGPVAVVSLSHPNLESLSPPKWKEEL